eukprot:CAMPEP_0175147336 /NCGR_PEP_ID=MMETSP0087-20121206/15930_1 /TAXON_ID=136419 /ORGANISM="Unknown Unknown, Strain D1" /LENGTH=721 /DNA_ID=CAMNT_0016432503 /DNA_START=28 /DNA_END=2193 /DNA_ORIENTATION=+
MGVHGLTKKVQDTPGAWSADDGETKFVVDGHALLHYVCTAQRRNFASAYHEFSKIFADILQKFGEGRIARVIFDGATPKEKLPQSRHRQKERQEIAAQWSSYFHFGQGSRCRDSNNHLFMPFCVEAAIEVLQQHSIAFEVWDEEADERVVEVAKELKAAAVSQDSDFFLVDIPQGYIPISRLLKKRQACVYSFSAFCQAVDLTAEQMQKLPSFMGCDYTPPNEKGVQFAEACVAIKKNAPAKFKGVEWPRSVPTIDHPARSRLRVNEYCVDLLDAERNLCVVNDVLVEAEDVAYKATQLIRGHVYMCVGIKYPVKENRHERAVMVEPSAFPECAEWASMDESNLMVAMCRHGVQYGRFDNSTVAALVALFVCGVAIDGYDLVAGHAKVERQEEEEGGEGGQEAAAGEGESQEQQDKDAAAAAAAAAGAENTEVGEEKAAEDDGWEQASVKPKRDRQVGGTHKRQAEADRLDTELNNVAVAHHNHWQALCISVRMLLHCSNKTTAGWFRRFWCMGEHFFYLRSRVSELSLVLEAGGGGVAQAEAQEPNAVAGAGGVSLLDPAKASDISSMIAAVFKDLSVAKEKRETEHKKKKKQTSKQAEAKVESAAPTNAFAGLLSEDEASEPEEEEQEQEQEEEPVPEQEEEQVPEPQQQSKKGKKGKGKGKSSKGKASGNQDDGLDDLMADLAKPSEKVAPPKLSAENTEGLTKAQLKRLKKKQAGKK